MNIRAFAKITHQHEAVLLPAFINEHTIACLMFTFLIAVSHAIAFHQLNLLVVFGQYTVVQTRTCPNIHVVACTGQIITLFLCINP